MSKNQIIKAANVGQIILGGVILALQVAGLIRNGNGVVKTNVGSAPSA